MKNFIKVLIVLLVIVVLTPFFAYKYLFSSGPKDLGVTYTPADYSTTHQKIGVEVGSIDTAASPKESLQYQGKKDIKVSLDSKELTSYVNAETWKYAPLSKLQIKINPDGTGEASGIINLVNVFPFISMTTPTDEVNKAIQKFKITDNPSFYTAGKVSVVNNLVKFEISSLEIGRIPVPAKYIAENLVALNNFVDDRLNAVPSLMVRTLTLNDGKVNLDATVPEKILKLQK